MAAILDESLRFFLRRREESEVELSETEELLNCGSGGGSDSHSALRIVAIFVILVGSTFGALFPVLARKSKLINVPKSVFNFAKYFGSGVILATGFIHLLAPALDALGSECLSPAWREYPYALAICMVSIFGIFLLELVAFRWGTAKLAEAKMTYDAHGHASGAVASHGPESSSDSSDSEKQQTEGEHHDYHWSRDSTGMTQAIGLAILEFGVVLHSVLIGLTLAVAKDFIILFVVLVFHQTFEGLGLGSRLAYINLPPKFRHLPVYGAIFYGFTTPIGLAIGLAVRTSYNPEGTTASIVSGILDATSSGILIYTGLVELLAHDFLFNKEMMAAPTRHLVYALGSMMLGAALMSLLGKWA